MPFTQFGGKLVAPSRRDSVYLAVLVGFLVFLSAVSTQRGRGVRVLWAGYGKDKEEENVQEKDRTAVSRLLGKAVGVSMTKPSISIGSLCLISF